MLVKDVAQEKQGDDIFRIHGARVSVPAPFSQENDVVVVEWLHRQQFLGIEWVLLDDANLRALNPLIQSVNFFTDGVARIFEHDVDTAAILQIVGILLHDCSPFKGPAEKEFCLNPRLEALKGW